MGTSFLDQRQNEYHTPVDLLQRLINDAIGHNPTSFEPIRQGYAAEVYRAFIDDSEPLIIRIQRHGAIPFAMEAWAMEQCRQVDVPVPRVYGVTQIETDNEQREAMVLAQAKGSALADVMPNLDVRDKKLVFHRLGQALTTLHSIPVATFGLLSNRDKVMTRWTDYADKTISDRESDTPWLRKAGLGEAEAVDLLVIVGSLATYSCDQPVLCHGDLSTDHVFVDEDLQLTSIIDFGICQGGPGIVDLAIFLMFHPDIELSWIQSGYGSFYPSSTVGRRHLLACQANTAMMYLAHDMREENYDANAIALASMRSIIEMWNQI